MYNCAYIRQQRNTATNLATITQFQVFNSIESQTPKGQCTDTTKWQGQVVGRQGQEEQTKDEEQAGQDRGKDDERKCEDSDNSWPPQATEVVNRQATTKKIKEEASFRRSTIKYLVEAKNLQKK